MSLARKLGVSEGTIRFRLNKMKKRGIVKGYTARLDLERLGFKTSLFLIRSDEPKALANHLRFVSSVSRIIFASGDFNLIIEASADKEDLADLVHNLKNCSLVKRFSEVPLRRRVKDVSSVFQMPRIGVQYTENGEAELVFKTCRFTSAVAPYKGSRVVLLVPRYLRSPSENIVYRWGLLHDNFVGIREGCTIFASQRYFYTVTENRIISTLDSRHSELSTMLKKVIRFNDFGFFVRYEIRSAERERKQFMPWISNYFVSREELKVILPCKHSTNVYNYSPYLRSTYFPLNPGFDPRSTDGPASGTTKEDMPISHPEALYDFGPFQIHIKTNKLQGWKIWNREGVISADLIYEPQMLEPEETMSFYIDFTIGEGLRLRNAHS